MSCCAVVIDSDGNVHMGWESGLSISKLELVVKPPKMDTLTNGDCVLTVGSVSASNQLIEGLEIAEGNPKKIPSENWILDDKNEAESSAILIKKNGSGCFYLDGPKCFFEIKSPGYFAIGSGEVPCVAVLRHVLGGKSKITPSEAKKALKAGIDAACALDSGCSLPLTIETLEVA